MLNSSQFVKINEETVINTKYIRWIKTNGKCFNICNKLDGCSPSINASKQDTHIICKTDNSEFYEQINKLFREEK